MPVTLFVFFFNDTATTEIYTLSLHDALPISSAETRFYIDAPRRIAHAEIGLREKVGVSRSEEHTSELQSRPHLVCRLLLEKKKTQTEPRQSSPRQHGNGAPTQQVRA